MTLDELKAKATASELTLIEAVASIIKADGPSTVNIIKRLENELVNANFRNADSREIGATIMNCVKKVKQYYRDQE